MPPKARGKKGKGQKRPASPVTSPAQAPATPIKEPSPVPTVLATDEPMVKQQRVESPPIVKPEPVDEDAAAPVATTDPSLSTNNEGDTVTVKAQAKPEPEDSAPRAPSAAASVPTVESAPAGKAEPVDDDPAAPKTPQNQASVRDAAAGEAKQTSPKVQASSDEAPVPAAEQDGTDAAGAPTSVPINESEKAAVVDVDASEAEPVPETFTVSGPARQNLLRTVQNSSPRAMALFGLLDHFDHPKHWEEIAAAIDAVDWWISQTRHLFITRRALPDIDPVDFKPATFSIPTSLDASTPPQDLTVLSEDTDRAAAAGELWFITTQILALLTMGASKQRDALKAHKRSSVMAAAAKPFKALPSLNMAATLLTVALFDDAASAFAHAMSLHRRVGTLAKLWPHAATWDSPLIVAARTQLLAGSVPSSTAVVADPSDARAPTTYQDLEAYYAVAKSSATAKSGAMPKPMAKISFAKPNPKLTTRQVPTFGFNVGHTVSSFPVSDEHSAIAGHRPSGPHGRPAKPMLLDSEDDEDGAVAVAPPQASPDAEKLLATKIVMPHPSPTKPASCAIRRYLSAIEITGQQLVTTASTVVIDHMKWWAERKCAKNPRVSQLLTDAAFLQEEVARLSSRHATLQCVIRDGGSVNARSNAASLLLDSPLRSVIAAIVIAAVMPPSLLEPGIGTLTNGTDCATKIAAVHTFTTALMSSRDLPVDSLPLNTGALLDAACAAAIELLHRTLKGTPQPDGDRFTTLASALPAAARMLSKLGSKPATVPMVGCLASFLTANFSDFVSNAEGQSTLKNAMAQVTAGASQRVVHPIVHGIEQAAQPILHAVFQERHERHCVTAAAAVSDKPMASCVQELTAIRASALRDMFTAPIDAPPSVSTVTPAAIVQRTEAALRNALRTAQLQAVSSPGQRVAAGQFDAVAAGASSHHKALLLQCAVRAAVQLEEPLRQSLRSAKHGAPVDYIPAAATLVCVRTLLTEAAAVAEAAGPTSDTAPLQRLQGAFEEATEVIMRGLLEQTQRVAALASSECQINPAAPSQPLEASYPYMSVLRSKKARGPVARPVLLAELASLTFVAEPLDYHRAALVSFDALFTTQLLCDAAGKTARAQAVEVFHQCTTRLTVSFEPAFERVQQWILSAFTTASTASPSASLQFLRTKMALREPHGAAPRLVHVAFEMLRTARWLTLAGNVISQAANTATYVDASTKSSSQDQSLNAVGFNEGLVSTCEKSVDDYVRATWSPREMIDPNMASALIAAVCEFMGALAALKQSPETVGNVLPSVTADVLSLLCTHSGDALSVPFLRFLNFGAGLSGAASADSVVSLVAQNSNLTAFTETLAEISRGAQGIIDRHTERLARTKSAVPPRLQLISTPPMQRPSLRAPDVPGSPAGARPSFGAEPSSPVALLSSFTSPTQVLAVPVSQPVDGRAAAFDWAELAFQTLQTFSCIPASPDPALPGSIIAEYRSLCDVAAARVHSIKDTTARIDAVLSAAKPTANSTTVPASPALFSQAGAVSFVDVLGATESLINSVFCEVQTLVTGSPASRAVGATCPIPLLAEEDALSFANAVIDLLWELRDAAASAEPFALAPLDTAVLCLSRHLQSLKDPHFKGESTTSASPGHERRQRRRARQDPAAGCAVTLPAKLVSEFAEVHAALSAVHSGRVDEGRSAAAAVVEAITSQPVLNTTSLVDAARRVRSAPPSTTVPVRAEIVGVVCDAADRLTALADAAANSAVDRSEANPLVVRSLVCSVEAVAHAMCDDTTRAFIDSAVSTDVGRVSFELGSQCAGGGGARQQWTDAVDHTKATFRSMLQHAIAGAADRIGGSTGPDGLVVTPRGGSDHADHSADLRASLAAGRGLLRLADVITAVGDHAWLQDELASALTTHAPLFNNTPPPRTSMPAPSRTRGSRAQTPALSLDVLRAAPQALTLEAARTVARWSLPRSLRPLFDTIDATLWPWYMQRAVASLVEAVDAWLAQHTADMNVSGADEDALEDRLAKALTELLSAADTGLALTDPTFVVGLRDKIARLLGGGGGAGGGGLGGGGGAKRELIDAFKASGDFGAAFDQLAAHGGSNRAKKELAAQMCEQAATHIRPVEHLTSADEATLSMFLDRSKSMRQWGFDTGLLTKARDVLDSAFDRRLNTLRAAVAKITDRLNDGALDGDVLEAMDHVAAARQCRGSGDNTMKALQQRATEAAERYAHSITKLLGALVESIKGTDQASLPAAQALRRHTADIARLSRQHRELFASVAGVELPDVNRIAEEALREAQAVFVPDAVGRLVADREAGRLSALINYATQAFGRLTTGLDLTEERLPPHPKTAFLKEVGIVISRVRALCKSRDFKTLNGVLMTLDFIENVADRVGCAETKRTVHADVAGVRGEFPAVLKTFFPNAWTPRDVVCSLKNLGAVYLDSDLMEEPVTNALQLVLEYANRHSTAAAGETSILQSVSGQLMDDAGDHAQAVLRLLPGIFDKAHRQTWRRRAGEQTPEVVMKNFEMVSRSSGRPVKLKTEETDVLIGGLNAAQEAIREALAQKSEYPTVLGGCRESIHKAAAAAAEHATRTHFIQLVAAMVAGFTVFRSEDFYGSYDQNVAFQPHTAQILALLKLLDVDHIPESGVMGWFGSVVGKGKKVCARNQLSQILTGQGKSITLAMLASIFALLDYDVDIVCYSQALTERDEEDARGFLEWVGVLEKVKYETLSSLCERRFTPLRERVDAALANKRLPPMPAQEKAGHKSVLLIDEVDVFYSRKFYGKLFIPIARFGPPAVRELIREIFRNRHLDKKYSAAAYTKAEQATPELLKPVLARSIEHMCFGVTDYEFGNPVFDPATKLVGYKVADRIDYSLVYGDRTPFKYLSLVESGELQLDDVALHLSLSITIGQVSYAEEPHRYNVIVGVTGTLRTTCANRTDLLTPATYAMLERYRVSTFSYTPSVFGPSTVVFNPFHDVYLEATWADWVSTVERRCQDLATSSGGAAVVFVKNAAMMDQFKAFASTFRGVRFISEDSSNRERKAAINAAGNARNVTFFTRNFARGTDFSIHDGVKLTVVLLFLPSTRAETTQAFGRTGRQGKPGQVEYVLCKEQMEAKYESFTYAEAVRRKNDGTIADYFTTLQLERTKQKEEKREEAFEWASKAHNESAQIVQQIRAATCPSQVLKAAAENTLQGLSAPSVARRQSYHFAVDSSGSMRGSPWLQLCDAFDAFLSQLLTTAQGGNAFVTSYAFDSEERHLSSAPARDTPSLPRKNKQWGGTNFDCAFTALQQGIRTAPQDGLTQRTLVFMTDGEGYASPGALEELLQMDGTHGGISVMHIIFFGSAVTAQLQEIHDTVVDHDIECNLVAATDGVELQETFQAVAAPVALSVV